MKVNLIEEIRSIIDQSKTWLRLELEYAKLTIAEKLTPAIKDSVNFVNERVGPAVEWLLSHLPEVGIIWGRSAP